MAVGSPESAGDNDISPGLFVLFLATESTNGGGESAGSTLLDEIYDLDVGLWPTEVLGGRKTLANPAALLLFQLRPGSFGALSDDGRLQLRRERARSRRGHFLLHFYGFGPTLNDYGWLKNASKRSPENLQKYMVKQLLSLAVALADGDGAEAAVEDSRKSAAPVRHLRRG